MATAILPKRCNTESLIQALSDAGALATDWQGLVIHAPDGCFLSCGAMSFLCTWGLCQVGQGRRLHLRGCDKLASYLERMELHQHLGLPHASGQRRDETGRFLPLHLIDGDDDVFTTSNAVCDLVLHQFDDAAVLLPALEWSVNEIIDNIMIHSQTPVPGAVCAQYFPSRHQLDVGICDLGIGIRQSLQRPDINNHAEAVDQALQRGVTRDSDVGQGNGMAGALEIINKNRGALRVWTGDTLYRASGGAPGRFARLPAVPGTGVVLQFDTRHPVKLENTWIAGGDWSYINAEAERIEEAGGFKVADLCINTGTRPPAQRLRRKIIALLPEMEGPAVLDFTGVRRASSSFLDELLGRLAAHLGESGFSTKIRITGIDPQIRKQANVVIAQRLGELI
jgi:hypothetical protein